MAIRKSITQPLFNFLSGVFQSPGISAAPALNPGAVQIATASHGGLLRGAGSGISDSIPTMLSHGEFVTNANDTARFLPLLQAINNFSGSGGGGGSRGGGTVVQVIDQRGSKAAPVERQERTGANGTKVISLLIRDVVKRQVSTGELDAPFQSRFGLSPSTR